MTTILKKPRKRSRGLREKDLKAKENLVEMEDALKDLEENPEMEVREEHPEIRRMAKEKPKKITRRQRARKQAKIAQEKIESRRRASEVKRKDVDYRAKYGDWLEE